MSVATDSINPLDSLEMAGARRGWYVETENDDDTTRVVVLSCTWGIKTVIVQVVWQEVYGYVKISFVFLLPENLPNWAPRELCRLTNLMNDTTNLGRFVYQPSPDNTILPCIRWCYEVDTFFLRDDGDEYFADLLERVARTYDCYYPVVVAFTSAKPKVMAFDGELMLKHLGLEPEDAITQLYRPSLVGHA